MIFGFGKALALLTLLFLFICSLDLLSSAFRLLGGKTAGSYFHAHSCMIINGKYLVCVAPSVLNHIRTETPSLCTQSRDQNVSSGEWVNLRFFPDKAKE